MKQGKIHKSTWKKFSKVFIQIHSTYKKIYLGHTETTTNVQSNCIKLSGFNVDITRLFMHWEITENISCREQFYNPKSCSQVFRPTHILLLLSAFFFFFFRVNKTGNECFSE